MRSLNRKRSPLRSDLPLRRLSCRRQPRACGGFSVIEMVVALSIVALVTGVVVMLFARFAGRVQVQAEGASVAVRAHMAVNQMLGEVEDAGFPSVGMMAPGTSAGCIAQGFTQASDSSMTFEAALAPLWYGTGTPLSATGCPLFPSANSQAGFTALPVDTITYSIDGGTLTRTVTDKATATPVSTTTVLRGIRQANLSYLCLGSSGTSDTAPNVCGVNVSLTVATGSIDQQTGQPGFTAVNGTAYARNVVLSSVNSSSPSQGCDHVCSFSAP